MAISYGLLGSVNLSLKGLSSMSGGFYISMSLRRKKEMESSWERPSRWERRSYLKSVDSGSVMKGPI